MGSPQKVGTVWRHRVMIAGKRVSGTFDTKAAALAWEAEQRVSTPKGKAGLTKTCADAFENMSWKSPRRNEDTGGRLCAWPPWLRPTSAR